MIKVPVPRFTLPRLGSDCRGVHELLSGVYCTFTVCTPEGRVIGCIDVPGTLGLPESNHELKRKLLSQYPQRAFARQRVRIGALGAAELVPCAAG